MSFPPLLSLLLVFLAVSSSGCASLLRQATRPVMGDLSTAVRRQDDPELVRQASPTFILLADAMVLRSPEDPSTLLSASTLYTLYVGAFVVGDDDDRAITLALRGREYALRALRAENPALGAAVEGSFEEFLPALEKASQGDLPYLAQVMTSMTLTVRAGKGNVRYLVDLPKIRAVAEWVVRTDQSYDHAVAHIILGVLNGFLPPVAGGNPDKAAAHFQQAIELTGGVYLPPYVLYAEFVGRRTFDRELHDRLLRHVLEADIRIEPDLTLANALAREQALDLTRSADDYFGPMDSPANSEEPS